MVVIKTFFDLKGIHIIKPTSVTGMYRYTNKPAVLSVSFQLWLRHRGRDLAGGISSEEEVVGADGFVARACAVTVLRINHGHRSLGCQSGAFMTTVFKSSYALFS